jgi:L-malate glycosyltransferase
VAAPDSGDEPQNSRGVSELAVLIVADTGERPEAATIRSLGRLGARVRALVPSDARLADWLREWDVPVEPLRLQRARDLSGTESIRWHLDELRPQILQLDGPLATLNGLRAAQRRAVAVVVNRGGAGNADIMNRRDRASILSTRVSRIVCCADSVRRSFIDIGLGPLRVPPRKIVAIHPGQDVGWYRALPLDPAALGVPRGAFVVTCIARGRSRQRVRDVVRACDHLPSDLPIYFLLVGAAVVGAGLLGLVERSPYRDRFHVLGERDDAPQIVAASNVSVLPSAAGDALPSALFESMAYETPPIVDDAGGASEIVEHERSGLVVPAGDPKAVAAAILRLYNDRETCRRLGLGARRRVASEFTVQRAAAATLAMYRDVVNGPLAA